MVATEPATLTEMEPSDTWAGYAEHDLRTAISLMLHHSTPEEILEIFFDELSHERQGNDKNH